MESRQIALNYINGTLDHLVSWLTENHIGTTADKMRNIAQDMFWPVVNLGITPDDLASIREKTRTIPFVFEEGNLFENLLAYFDQNTRYVAFCKAIGCLTPCGLNTSPNANCGKWELLYRLLRPDSRQPARGDVTDNGSVIELKGGEIRMSSTNLTGKDYRVNCNSVFTGSAINPNTVSKGGLKRSSAFEIEKTQYRAHYKSQFEHDIPASKTLVSEYFRKNEIEFTHVDIDAIFANGEWNQVVLQRVLLRQFYKEYKEAKTFDTIYIFGDGSNLKIIKNEEDLAKLEIYSDYFRINQPGNVGWYVR